MDQDLVPKSQKRHVDHLQGSWVEFFSDGAGLDILKSQGVQEVGVVDDFLEHHVLGVAQLRVGILGVSAEHYQFYSEEKD